MDKLKELHNSEWYKTRPKKIRDMIDMFPGHIPVRIKSTGQKAHVYSYSENGTVSVAVIYSENPNIRQLVPDQEGHRVFGLSLSDIEKILIH